MNRSPWTAVFWTVLVLVGTTLSSYVPWNRIAPPLMHAASLSTSRQWSQLNQWVEEQRFVMALSALAQPAAPPVPAVYVAGAAALLVALVAVFAVLAIRARRQRLRVLRMAQRGNPMNHIARDTRLSQDAVRLLLSPMIDPSRARVRSGKSFRTSPAFAAARPRGGHSDAAAR